LNLSIEADGDAFFSKVLRDARSAAFVVIDRVSGAFVVDAGAERNACQENPSFAVKGGTEKTFQ